MAPHSSTLAWKIPWTEEPGRLQSMGSLRVGHDWATSLSLFTFMHWRRKWQPTPVFLPGESQGWGSLVGCRLWDHRESDTTEVTSQQQHQQAVWRIPRWLSAIESACKWKGQRRSEFDPWVEKVHWGGNGNPLQYSCLDNAMDRGAWQATVNGITESRTRLKWLSMSDKNIPEWGEATI